MDSTYSMLHRATLDTNFFKSNHSTNVFNSIAELIDNGRDAAAQNFYIGDVKNANVFGGWYISFLDDGEGMDPYECIDVTKFGNSKKRMSNNYIGRNGVGLKTASFRLSSDMILFTKRLDIFTIMFWSQTFYKECDLKEVVVAIPSFTSDKVPFYETNGESDKSKKKHDLEMELIFKYSPFKNIGEIFNQFDKIKSNSGTLIYCFNLWLTSEGKTEFSIDKEKNDLVLMGDAIDNSDINDLELEERSLREFVSILYTDPKMKIYIDGSKVRTRSLFYSLYLPYEYKYLAKNVFKRKTEITLEELRAECKYAQKKLAEVQSKEKHDRGTFMLFLNKSAEVKHRILQGEIAKYKNIVKEKQDEIKELEKKGFAPQLINFQLGANVHKPSQCGFFIYHGCRLISTPEKLKQQFEKVLDSNGIVGILTVPYSVMEPSQYKSDVFKLGLEKEIIKLGKALVEHLQSYVTVLKETTKREFNLDLKQTWALFGYNLDDNLSQMFPKESKQIESFFRQRFMRTKVLLQCDKCLKWRVMTHDKRFHNFKFPDNWCCSDLDEVIKGMNCNIPEKIEIRIGKGELIKSNEPRPIQNKRTTVCVDMLDEEDDDDIDDNVNIRKSLELGKPKRSKPLHIVFSRKVEKKRKISDTRSDRMSFASKKTVLPTQSPVSFSYTEFLQNNKLENNSSISSLPTTRATASIIRSDSSDFDDDIFHDLDSDNNTPCTSGLSSGINRQKRKANYYDDPQYKAPYSNCSNSKIPKERAVNLKEACEDDESIRDVFEDRDEVSPVTIEYENDSSFDLNSEDLRSFDSSSESDNEDENSSLKFFTKIFGDKLKSLLSQMKINEVDFKKFNNTQLSEYDVNDHFMRFLNMKEEKLKKRIDALIKTHQEELKDKLEHQLSRREKQ